MQDYSENNETRNKVLKMKFTYLNHFFDLFQSFLLV